MSSEEEAIESSIETYKIQLSQVDSALLAAGTEKNADLLKLKEDLQELISLTEENLLNAKKTRLLSMLDGKANSVKEKNATLPSTSEVDIDAEFAAFQACLADDLDSKPSSVSTGRLSRGGYSSSSSSSSSEDESDEQSSRVNVSNTFSELTGSKCRAPFSQSWGEKSYHDAMIISVEPFDTDQDVDLEPKVKVFFTHPTHRSMVPCQYFLDNICNYEDNCRFSHGYVVNVRDLKEYKDRDHGGLKLESKCLVKYKDNVWYPAVIVDVFPDQTYKVMFDENNELLNVSVEAVLPVGDIVSDDENESETENFALSSDSEDEALPVFLWRPGTHQTTDIMGGWEQHTRGIASKLMSKMGYVVGEGLGRWSKGRVEPVPIQLLPQGKSLDKIMELKALAGDRDLYDVMKKRKHHQKKTNKNSENEYQKTKKKKKEKTSVFDFINTKLIHKNDGTGLHSSHTKHHKHHHKERQQHTQPSSKHISEKELKNKSEKGLNIQLFQTLEEIKSTEKEIQSLKSTLTRNEGRDRKLENKVQEKISSLEVYLNKLKHSENSLQKHKKTRTDNKKLTVF